MKRMKDVLLNVDDSEYTIGQMVRAFRKGKNLTLEQVQELTGISITNLSAIENDKVDLGVKRASMLAVAFGVHPRDILFPNDKWEKSKEIQKIEARARKMTAV
ncbi:MAG: helix-turn-helix transcriptional regulator [Bdellovibrionaceae bacterium]|nr:helix-turn-helix transcriptional regulator [Pseudobdellovibrionaceae bacterium]